MNVSFSTAAKRDLGEIEKYIRGEGSPAGADRFVREIVQACADLAHMPKSHPIAPRHERRQLRRKVCGRYLIFFRITEEEVEIIRILHGSRDLIALLA